WQTGRRNIGGRCTACGDGERNHCSSARDGKLHADVKPASRREFKSRDERRFHKERAEMDELRRCSCAWTAVGRRISWLSRAPRGPCGSSQSASPFALHPNSCAHSAGPSRKSDPRDPEELSRSRVKVFANSVDERPARGRY